MADPVADELGRLVNAVQQWARASLPEPEPDAPECRWCPVCRLVAVLRGERPELTEQLVERGAALATALGTVFEHSHTAAGATTPPPPSTVQHIDIE